MPARRNKKPRDIVEPASQSPLSAPSLDDAVALQDRLHQSQDLLQSVVESAVDYAIFTMDIHGVITWWSKGAQSTFGYREDEVIGRSSDIIWKPEEVPREPIKERATAAENGCADDNRWHVRKGGERFYVHGALRTLRNAHGTITGFVKVCRDETERRKNEESLAFAAAIISSSDDAIISKTLDGVTRTWNESAQRLFGYAAEEIIGKPITLLFPPERMDEEPKIIARLKAGDRVEHFETVRIRKDGSRVDVSVTISPIRDSSGAIIGASKIARDISDRKRAESAVRESESRFRTMADSAPVLVWMSGTDKAGTWFNKPWLDFTGLTLEKAIGQGWTTVIHPQDLDLFHKIYRDSFDAHLPFKIDHRLRRYDGQYRWLVAQGIPLYSPDGTFSGYISSLIDITERKTTENERQVLFEAERAARSEAERVGKLKDEFLATLSHELRTPLNAILGWSQVMKRTDNPADIAQAVEVIERNARSQAQIIEDLLDMSRIISGKVRLDVQHLDLSALILGSLETIRPAADAKGVRLNALLDPLTGAAVSGDANRLQQVLWNLLSNAVKFTPDGGSVNVGLRGHNAQVEITVSDTGEGIKPDFLPFVFDRFRQADASTTRRHGGLGLGLAIVKTLVELHGGTVGASSAGEGKGTTFTLILPLVKTPRQEDVSPLATQIATVNDHMMAKGCTELKGLRLLIVDDELDARALIKRLLEDCGAVVTTAASANEAVRLMQRGRFDVLISDIGMPGDDGYALMRHIRTLDKSKGGAIPAIALTAYARAEDRIRAVTSGFLMHVAKPVEPVELVTMVAAAAGRAGKR